MYCLAKWTRRRFLTPFLSALLEGTADPAGNVITVIITSMVVTAQPTDRASPDRRSYQAKPPVEVDVCPEQRRRAPQAFLGEHVGPPEVLQDRLKELDIDEHQGWLEEVKREHGHLGVLTVGADQHAFPAVEEP
jgi:hypothetical protein